MANSIQEFNGKFKVFNDLDLIVVILLVLKRLSKTQKSGLLGKIIESWKGILTSYAPGVIDLELTSLIRSTEEKTITLNLLSQIEMELSNYREVVPASVLNNLTITPEVKFIDYKIKFIVTTLTSLKELLK